MTLRRSTLSLILAFAAGAALGATGCGSAPKPEPARTEAPPAVAPAPAPEPAPPVAAPTPPPPKDLASATPENPLRPAAHVGPSIRSDAGPPKEGPPKLETLKLPPGFAIEVYATGVPNARSLAPGAPGIVYVSTRRDKRVYAVVDRNRDHKADKVYTIAQGLDVPNGLAYRN